jgi:hypothetical protein
MLDREANLCSVLTALPLLQQPGGKTLRHKKNKKKINKYTRISNLLNPSVNRLVATGDP